MEPFGCEGALPKLNIGADDPPNRPWLGWELVSCVAPPKLMDGAGVFAPKVKEVEGCEPASLPKLKDGGADVVPGAANGLPPVGPAAAPPAENENDAPPPAPKMDPAPLCWLADCCDGAVVLPKLNMLELGGGAAGVVLPKMVLGASGWLVRVEPKIGFAAPDWLAGVALKKDGWEVLGAGAGVAPKMGFTSAGVDELAAPKSGLLSEEAGAGVLPNPKEGRAFLVSVDPKSGLLAGVASAEPKAGAEVAPKAGFAVPWPNRLAEGGAAAGVSLDEGFPNSGAWEDEAGSCFG